MTIIMGKSEVRKVARRYLRGRGVSNCRIRLVALGNIDDSTSSVLSDEEKVQQLMKVFKILRETRIKGKVVLALPDDKDFREFLNENTEIRRKLDLDILLVNLKGAVQKIEPGRDTYQTPTASRLFR